MEIFEFVQKYVKILQDLRSDFLKSPGQMNLLEMTANSHYENLHSDILAFLLEPQARHHHPEFGEEFLSLIKRKCGAMSSGKIITVTREKSIDKNRRIDIFIETDKDVLIVENKIYAKDQPDQLKDYIEWAENTSSKNKNIIVLYLTLDGNLPTSISLTHEMIENLVKENRFANISYEIDILQWLNSLVVDKQIEEVLHSALIQYEDSIKGLCRLKEEDKMEDTVFAKKLFDDYGKLNRKELSEVLDVVELIRNQICFTAIVNFIRELYSLLSPSNTVYYTHHQKRYPNEEEWLEKILTDRMDVGLEVALEEKGSHKFGLAIEFSSMDLNTSVDYGIMSHGNSNNGKTDSPNIFGILSNWRADNYQILQNEYWWEVISIGKWFTSALFRTGNHANWQENQLKLVEHVQTLWFMEDLENYAKTSNTPVKGIDKNIYVSGIRDIKK